MIDHLGLGVSDFAASKTFYAQALNATGYELLLEFPAAGTDGHAAAGFGAPPKPDFWIGSGKPNVPPVHVAFQAAARAQVDAFYRAALAAGGRDNGPAGPRSQYHADYYGAFVLDPDGHNVEVVCHQPA
jgi:catechol 2,3-dioxygenase-like lactoylglutathione lyase family enzyme